MKVFIVFAFSLLPFVSFEQLTRLYGGNGSLTQDGVSVEFAQLGGQSFVTNSSGDLILISDGKIKKVDRYSKIVTTLVGCTGAGCTNPEGGSALLWGSINPWCLAIDSLDNLFFIDVFNVSNRKIRKYNAQTGTLSLVTGGTNINSDFLAIGPGGYIYFSSFDNTVRRLNPLTGTISNYAGSGIAGFNGDGGSAIFARLNSPQGLVFDTIGNLYIADRLNYRIRKVNPSGIISTFAGNGVQGVSCDNCTPTSSPLGSLWNITTDEDGNVYFFEEGTILKKVSICDGNMITIGGTGENSNVILNVDPLLSPLTNSGYASLCVDRWGSIFFHPNEAGIFFIESIASVNQYAGNDITICIGNSTQVNFQFPEQGIHYWTNGYVDGTSISPIDTSYLSVHFTDLNGCHQFTDEIAINVISRPTIDAFTDNEYICGDAPITLSATTQENCTIKWYNSPPPDNPIFTGGEYTSPVLNGPASFFIEAYNTVYDCVSEDVSTINVSHNPPDQCTFVPDNNFEETLIEYGYDQYLNNFVVNDSINSVETLNVENRAIASLVGIEGFTALKVLYAGQNLIEQVDFSMNSNLESLHFDSNFLTFLDLSNNDQLNSVYVSNNLLTCLNVKNGNNVGLYDFYTHSNPNLNCIQVDDEDWVCTVFQNPNIYPQYGWYNEWLNENTNCDKYRNDCFTDCSGPYQVFGCTDPEASNFNPLANFEDGSCTYLGLSNNQEIEISIHYNNDYINVSVTENNIQKLKVSDMQGRIVMNINGINSNTLIHSKDLLPGIYFFEVSVDGNLNLFRKILVD